MYKVTLLINEKEISERTQYWCTYAQAESYSVILMSAYPEDSTLVSISDDDGTLTNFTTHSIDYVVDKNDLRFRKVFSGG